MNTTPPAEDIPPPCSFCPREATRELCPDTFACSEECEAKYAAQFCPTCSANLAEGEQHSRQCREDYLAECDADDWIDDWANAGGWS